MKIETIQLSLEELKEAIAQWCHSNAPAQPEIIKIVSHDKEVIIFDMTLNGIVEAIEFIHRSGN